MVGDGGRSRAADLAGEAELGPVLDVEGVAAPAAATLFAAGVEAFFVRADMMKTVILSQVTIITS